MRKGTQEETDDPYAPPSAPRHASAPRHVSPSDRPAPDPGSGDRGREPRTSREPSRDPGSRPRPTPDQVRTASRRTFAAAGFTFGALVTTALPLPGPAFGAVLAVAALVTGIRALVAVLSAGLQRSLLPVVAVGLALALLYLVSSLGVIATWPIQQERQDCLARALTVSARDACEEDYREAIESLNRPRP